jgi:ferredoxin
MKTQFNRRGALARLGGILAGVLALPVARTAKAAVQRVFVSSGAARGYDPSKHKWLMCIDVNKCIGCGLCAEACKKENGVPEGPYFRTWIERYIIQKPKPGSGQTRGETLVDSPDGAFVFRPEAVQLVRAFALRPGVSGRGDV